MSQSNRSRMLERMSAIAREVGLDPTDAWGMDFAEFCRVVSMRRAAKDSQRIALAVVARRSHSSAPPRAL